MLVADKQKSESILGVTAMNLASEITYHEESSMINGEIPLNVLKLNPTIASKSHFHSLN